MTDSNIPLTPEGKLLAKYPIARIKTKTQWFWYIGFINKFIHLDTAITTIWRTVWVPKNWSYFDDTTKTIILEHEEQHLRQMGVQFGWWGFPLFLLMALFYAILPLPVFLSGRMLFEGWAFGWSNIYHRGLDTLDHYLDRVCGPNYLWAGPRGLVRKIMLWAKEKREQQEKEGKKKDLFSWGFVFLVISYLMVGGMLWGLFKIS